MRHPILLGVSILSLTLALTGCENAVSTPVSADGTEISKMPIDEPSPIDEPCVDLC